VLVAPPTLVLWVGYIVQCTCKFEVLNTFLCFYAPTVPLNSFAIRGFNFFFNVSFVWHHIAMQSASLYYSSAVSNTVNTPPSAIRMIRDQCCSFPFSLNGSIYLTCVSMSSDPEEKGCYMSQRTWIRCLPPAGKLRADHTCKNVFTFPYIFTCPTYILKIPIS